MSGAVSTRRRMVCVLQGFALLGTLLAFGAAVAGVVIGVLSAVLVAAMWLGQQVNVPPAATVLLVLSAYPAWGTFQLARYFWRTAR